ncbi:hypothetical protein [uncultured Pseudomonas sp.]|uniref:hypothetical protein n=1 Tax=uncultured Pseudomonas sp. TaxID=114707 RepID=UPI0026308F4B|nr:hypothetical protein [uncultured Pseudomonas sp.]
MSLETTIASLVTAANALTAAVNGKISEIDAKNTEFINSFAANLASALTKTLYVNPATGSDSNPGTAALPKKTIAGCVAVLPSGSTATINLAGDQTHYVSSVTCRGLTITFTKWGGTVDPIVKVEPVEYTVTAGQTLGIGFRLYTSRLTFTYCTIDTGDYYPGATTQSMWSGFFGRTDNSNAYVFLWTSKIILRTTPLLRIPSGGALFDLSFYNCTMERANSAVTGNALRVKVIENEVYSPIRFHWASMTLNDVKFSELVSLVFRDSSGRVTNVACPIDLAAHITAGT